MMPASNSEQHAMLIREMSRDLNRSRKKAPSSNGDASSSSSAFDPENEAVMSTRQLDNLSQPLPRLPESPKKHSHHQQPQLDYAINTSAIGRAFPEFTQSTDLEEDDSLSIEIGRGGKDRNRDYSLSIQGHGMNPILAPGNHQINSTPPKAASYGRAEKKAGGVPGGMRRDAQIRQASTALPRDQGNTTKRGGYLPERNQQSNDKPRQTLGDLHARIAQEYDESQITDERPPTLNLTKKSTRFGGAQMVGNGLPSKFTSSRDLASTLANGVPKASEPKNRPKNATLTSNTAMENSFMLPDLPNLSELVSGVFQDGSPVFSRNGKPKGSRFASNPRNRDRGNDSHAAIISIPIPEDEQAIYVSLKLLQDKVADLEQHKAESEAVVQELEARNKSLEQERLEQRRFRRSDSALGSTDGSDDGVDAIKGSRKLAIENSRLESTVRALQEQVSKAAKKSSIADISIKNLTQERDSAISQLEVAYFMTEQLKIEKQALSDEMDQLKAQLEHAALADQNERGLAKNGPVQSSTSYFRGRETAARVEEDMSTRATAPLRKTRLPSGAAPGVQDDHRGKAKQSQVPAESKPMVNPRRSRQPVHNFKDDSDCEGDFAAEPTSTQRKNDAMLASKGKNDDAADDITYLSFTNNNDIAELRKALELERIARKDAATATKKHPADEAAQTGFSGRHAPRGKPSMKDADGKLNRRDKAEQVDEITAHSRTSRVPAAGRHFEESILEHEIRRGDMHAEDLTSAFIVPDITMRRPGLATEPLELSTSAQRVFDGLARHDGQKCTVCKQYVTRGREHGHGAHESIVIPKPVPVSDRMPEPDAYEEEPTQRPSQAPGLALAAVLKGLENELAHLKIKASQYQSLYNQQDPSLSKRKRKSVLLKIETTLKAVDVKADQIYALYDVLEGQKASGLEISDEQVEVTLQSIGIDLAAISLRGGGLPEYEKASTAKASQPALDDNSSLSDNDLPWEGIESTANLTVPSIFAGRRNSWDL